MRLFFIIFISLFLVGCADTNIQTVDPSVVSEEDLPEFVRVYLPPGAVRKSYRQDAYSYKGVMEYEFRGETFHLFYRYGETPFIIKVNGRDYSEEKSAEEYYGLK